MATGGASDLAITDLGRWALHHLDEGLASPADPEVPAAEMIAKAVGFEDAETRVHVASAWLEHRKPDAAVREILTAAAGMTAAQRLAAVEIAADVETDALDVWWDMATDPVIGPHAAVVLWQHDQRAEVPAADQRWLAAERAAIAVGQGDPDKALTALSESLPGDNADEWLRAAATTGHPDVKAIASAVAGFVASGAPRSIDAVLQLKVTLRGYGTWRRVQMRATDTLEELHEAIQSLFGWDGDHLYVFEVGKRHYSGGFYHLEDTGYDDEIRLGEAFAAVKKARTKKIAYTYDLGASWEHEITLEKTLTAEPGQDYPLCTAFAGDYPIEYPEEAYEDSPPEPRPFDIDEANQALQRGASS